MPPKISILTPIRAKEPIDFEWLNECIASVMGQTVDDWEHIIVDDHSAGDIGPVRDKWPHVRWLEAEYQGVSAARNQAAEMAGGELLLPLDADDKLATTALETWLKEWNRHPDAGILYSDVVMFGEDYARVYLAPEYNFRTLLTATIMVVGALHRKADWQRVGGWRLDMTAGLEDWEYWIALGEIGVCGKRIPEPLYWYRRHPRGRLRWLQANREKWDRAYHAMRELHIDSYNGRYPMGCCGGKSPPGARRSLHGGMPRTSSGGQTMNYQAGDTVQMIYVGTRQGSFEVISGVTRTRYLIPGAGSFVELGDSARQGVLPRDVPWFRSVNRARDFKIVETPAAPSAVTTPAPPKPLPVASPEENPAWSEAIMEGPEVAEIIDSKEMELEIPDVITMTVKAVKTHDWSAEGADAALAEELRGDAPRKTVIAHLERIIDAT